jgi:hypothetical protein
MPHAAHSTLSVVDPSGATRMRSMACRVYGALAVLVGLAGLAMSGAASSEIPITARTVPLFLGPPLALLILGALIFRQSAIAAIVLPGVIGLHEVLIRPLLVSTCSAALSFGMADAIVWAAMLSLTAIIVIADCAARGAEVGQ